MVQRTTRIYHDTIRNRVLRRSSRRWRLWVAALVLIAAAVWLFTRDTRWRTRNREARARGVAADLSGQVAEARLYYGEALASHPYDWQTHVSLARILYHWQNDYTDALRHYLLAMAYCPDPAVVEEISRTVGFLTMVREGTLENPVEAVEDMFLAVESGSEYLFRQRLRGNLIPDFDLFWKAWKERGRGTPFYHSIAHETDGEYEAGVEVVFPDGINMFMRFSSRRHDIWRLSLSFP